jgi:hypothetical protein
MIEPKVIPSFQQELSEVVAEGIGRSIRKRIVSDYSWWTFDESDLYHREHRALVQVGKALDTPILLRSDDDDRSLLMRWFPDDRRRVTFREQLDIMLDLLSLFRDLDSEGFDDLPPSRLCSQFVDKGARSGISDGETLEIQSFFRKWEGVYGARTSFVHGDFHTGNVLWSDECDLIPIDFEETIRSLPAFDAANLACELHQYHGMPHYRYFRDRYESRFREPLIEFDEWQSFCRLRNKIVRSYLCRCCAPEVKVKATSFTELETM